VGPSWVRLAHGEFVKCAATSERQQLLTMAAIKRFFSKIAEWLRRYVFLGHQKIYVRSLFWKEEMELTLVGLQNSGKTTLVNVIAVRFSSFGHLFDFSQTGDFQEDQSRQ